MESSEILATIETLHTDARRRGLFFQSAEDHHLVGRTITLHGRELLSFGSCSYLGLEMHPSLAAGVIDAVTRFGTQFSCSRGYLSIPLYAELEALFCRIFDAHVLVAPTTTLAHQAAFDVLITEKDAVVLDHQAHQSVHQAAQLARSRGAHVALVRHEDLGRAESMIARLAPRHRTVWFCIDGIVSMYGDLAPYALIARLMAVAPNVRIYVDDAHGMSWAGKFGRGKFLDNIPLGPQIVVATSLAKAFGCGGGLLIFDSAEERERVRMCGGTMIFSGPLQPPMLGAALASARLHLTDELVKLQETLRARVLFANHLFHRHGLPLLAENDVPIRFIRMGLPRAAAEVAQRMAADGVYVNISMFPTVPMRRAGIRISINANHREEDIARMATALARHVPDVLGEEHVSRADLDALFARSVVGPVTAAASHSPRTPAEVGDDGLHVETHTTIHTVDRAEWDRLLGTVGTCSWESMVMVERLFAPPRRPEHVWTFEYVFVRDAAGKPVCATLFTTSLQKDDFLMRDEVSRAVERRRVADPYFLSSLVVMSGSVFSEGHHVYVDRDGPWQRGLTRLLEHAARIYERERADVLMLRDMPGDDPEMEAFMLHQGLVGVPMLDSHELALDFRDEQELAMRLSHYKRRDMRQQARKAAHYDVHVWGAGSPERARLGDVEASYLFDLYRNVARRKFRINIFELPAEFVAAIQDSPVWEIVTLTLRPEHGGPAHGRPVAWYAAHLCAGHYAALVCGLDYDYVIERGVYKQMIYQMIHQSHLRGMQRLHLGMDADIEKQRYRPAIVKNRVYLQARDHYNSSLLRDVVAEVGLGQPTPTDPGPG